MKGYRNTREERGQDKNEREKKENSVLFPSPVSLIVLHFYNTAGRSIRAPDTTGPIAARSTSNLVASSVRLRDAA
jgi:hypothetical protein